MATEMSKREVAAPAKDWLTKSEVCELLGGFSETTLDRQIAAGLFPRGVSFPGGASKWRWVDVAWYMLGREIADRLEVEPGAEGESPTEPQPAPRGSKRPQPAPPDTK